MAVLDYEEICGRAVHFAETYGKVFDYSADSVAALDELLQIYYDCGQEGRYNDEQLWNVSITLGVYLGECMLRTVIGSNGYAWFFDGKNAPYLRMDGKTAMYPVTKVYKRVTNGPEDNVKSFYDIGIKIADGSFNLSAQ